jgi:acyl-coenzyme A thioesterase PaaI-like protein
MHPLGEFDKFLDYRIVSCEDGKSEVVLSVRDELKQRLGLLHG